MSRKAGGAFALLSSRSRVTWQKSRMILWLEVDCTCARTNYVARKRLGVTEHCLRGRPVKPRRAGQQSTRFNSLNRSLGSIFRPYARRSRSHKKISWKEGSQGLGTVDSLRSKAEKASKLVARVPELMIDRPMSPEERQRRKRALIKEVKERN